MRRSQFHPWHDIAPGPSVPDVLTAVIEIPRHSRGKYEIDKETGMFRLDRVLHSAVHYPGDYGFIPQTLGDDGDPLDIMLMMTAPVFPGCLVEVRPIGIFNLVDRGDGDEKIIAVPTRDPFTDQIRDINDIRSHALLEVEHFFQVYKDLENVRVESRGFDNAAAAKKVILAAVANYKRKFTARKRASRAPRTR